MCAFGLQSTMMTTRNQHCLNLCYIIQHSERVSMSLIISTLKDYRFPNASCALQTVVVCNVEGREYSSPYTRGGLEMNNGKRPKTIKGGRKGAVTKLEKEVLYCTGKQDFFLPYLDGAAFTVYEEQQATDSADYFQDIEQKGNLMTVHEKNGSGHSKNPINGSKLYDLFFLAIEDEDRW